MVLRRKPSWSGEFLQKGTSESSGNKRASKLIYKKGVLVNSSSSTNLENGAKNQNPFPPGIKVKRSNSLFNFSDKDDKEGKENNNNKDNEFCLPIFHGRRNTCAENILPPDETKLHPNFEQKLKNNSCEALDKPETDQLDPEETNPPSDSVVEEDLICGLDSDPDTMALVNKSHNNSQTNTRQKDFIPSFVLVDACKEANERKIRELAKRLCCIGSVELDPVVNFQDLTGRTALSYACGSGNVKIIEELTKLRRLNPNLPDNDGNTPLHYASQAGHSEAVDLILSRFDGVIDPNCRNSTGLTPLMKAALQGRSRICKSLITAGAQPYLQDYSRNLTAIEWARLCGRHICAEVIIRSAKDNYKHPGSPPPINYKNPRPMPGSQSSMELKRINSDDSPYYNLYQTRSTVSGAAWLKNKIRKAIGSTTGANSSSMSKSSSHGHDSYALMSNLTGATICASSMLLPSIKPLLEQQQRSRMKKKLTIPTLQVTLVNKR